MFQIAFVKIKYQNISETMFHCHSVWQIYLCKMKHTTYSDQYLLKFIKEKVHTVLCVCVCFKWLNTSCWQVAKIETGKDLKWQLICFGGLHCESFGCKYVWQDVL